MTSHTPRRLRRILAAVAAASTLVLASCANNMASSSSAPADDASGPTLVQAGKLTVCTHLSYKPFEFKDNQDKVVGFDVDLLDLVAKKLGVTQEIVDIDFASMTSGAVFAAKKCDVAMGAITITEERQKTILFSDPYFKATQALIAKKDAGIKDLSDLKGKKLGVQTDTTGQIYAEKNKDANGYEVVVFDDMPSELTAVVAGRVDAAINDNGVMFDFVKDNPSLTVPKEFSTNEQYGFLSAKDDPNAKKLIDVVNEVLKTAKAGDEYKTIYKKWFGVEPPE